MKCGRKRAGKKGRAWVVVLGAMLAVMRLARLTKVGLYGGGGWWEAHSMGELELGVSSEEGSE